MIKLSEAFKTDENTKRVFSWLTRIGSAPKFGSRPIGWYQIHQCVCIDILREKQADFARCKNGMIQTRQGGKWADIMSADTLFRLADDRCRK